ncbi:cation:proton antiporter [Catalinimonas niigatensis]|uniref:cation:proton antiporter n=1 Tax=Catalinimonas niigatensis TaxID=1397264 RepID=UPI00266631DE|nr:cation:proton antiporter [Catalinimonas niigatensis]WPP49165.1 cation:proton antiporter [Catalinimonas niigatensis]
MDTYILSLTIVGFAAFGMVWIPILAKKMGISYSIVYLLLGIILYSVFDTLPWPNPLWEENFTVHMTELIVIVALMGTGLKIDHRFSFREWRVPFRLITITMLLSIGIFAFVGYWFLGFNLPSAILLGAVLAPTDPVLASDVQVGPPNEGENDDVRLALTTEAGMNDGMAFPFIWLAIVLALSAQTGESWFLEWLGRDLIYRLVAGVAVGFGMGKAFIYLFFKLPEKLGGFENVRDGFVAFSTTLMTYGITEMIHGYGFMAVFVVAVTIRNYEMRHEYHRELHHFTDQIERILLAILLLLFGGSLVKGILDGLNWEMALAGIAFVLLIRPLTGLIALLGTKLKFREKFAISFFGIKGIGSFFYLSFALSETEFFNGKEVWALVAFIVLLSILIHGLTAPFAMKKLKLRYIQEKKAVT